MWTTNQDQETDVQRVYDEVTGVVSNLDVLLAVRRAIADAERNGGAGEGGLSHLPVEARPAVAAIRAYERAVGVGTNALAAARGECWKCGADIYV